MKQISIAETIKEGLEAAKQNGKSVVLLFVSFDIVLSVLTTSLNLGILNLLTIIEVLFLQIVLYKSFQKPYSNFDIKQILSLNDPHTKTNLWKLFIMFLINLLLVALLLLLFIAPGIIFRDYLYLTSFVVLNETLPSIIFMIFLYLTSFIVLNENLSGMSALKRSRELIKGHWWKTFGLFLLIIIPYLLGSLLLFVLAETSFIFQILYAGFNGLISVVIGYIVLAYYFKLRKSQS